MPIFKQGDQVKSVHVYGPADTDFSDTYYDMHVSMETGQYAGVPWIEAVHRDSGQVTMINCDKCACIILAEPR